jgi:hypothetical protein
MRLVTLLDSRHNRSHHLPCCAVQLRTIALELDSVESVLGRESARMLRDLALSQHTWCRERLAQMIAVRQVPALVMEAPCSQPPYVQSIHTS